MSITANQWKKSIERLLSDDVSTDSTFKRICDSEPIPIRVQKSTKETYLDTYLDTYQ